MSWTVQVLVVANATAGSPDLRRALQARAARGPAAFTLVMPVDHATPRELARSRLEEALEYHRAGGLRIDGMLGHYDPVLAVSEVWDPKRFDEIIVCTLPAAASRWLRWGLPRRIAQVIDAPLTLVEARAPEKAPVA